LEDTLEFVLVNYHRRLRHGVIGRATFPLSILADDPTRTGEERPIFKNTTEVNGILLFDVFYYPILHPDVEKELGSTGNTLFPLKFLFGHSHLFLSTRDGHRQFTHSPSTGN